MPSWLLYGVLTYIIIGGLLGELYRWGCKKDGRELRKGAYFLGVATWPIALCMMIFPPKRGDR